MPEWDPILLANVHRPNSERIDTYLRYGGYEALRKALKLSPEDIIAEVKASGLRGRGGAGFPTGVKWGFMPKDAPVKYLAINTDEGEPGTFKDRLIVERDPHSILEGVIIAAYAVGANRAFVYIRGEFFLGVKRWIKAISDAYQHGFLGKDILGSGFDLDVSVHRGAGAYICGEETAMIESLEGKRGVPRAKPPFPAQKGMWGKPTIVQNVETLTNIPHIILRGSQWYSTIGTEKSKGIKIFCVSGHVNRPGNFELPLGTKLKDIIYEHAGGVRKGRDIKAIIPGGASTPIITGDKVSTPMAFETLQAAGTALGTGAVIVMDETTDMVEVVRRITRFFVHESCGNCFPCRIGGHNMLMLLEKLAAGQGSMKDIEELEYLAKGITGRTFCPMGTGMVEPILSALRLFRPEFEGKVAHH
ncbi:MAG TPA: NADH-quinone oxidoreductase subunit NuoF [Deltaproteobacteria bacterium]|jgi:NADH-quinone oxidoreductase subunit F|nr:NADH-quinone oxidoreductase subunit NuoF [Deltaproteobacteria bacterium]